MPIRNWEKELEQLAEYAKGKGALYQKLKDLGVLYHEFLAYIGNHYITTEETLDILCRMLPKSKLIEKSVIAFDGFTGFTPIQNRLIQRLMELAKEVIVTVSIDEREDPFVLDGEQKLFYLSKKTVADLKKLAEESGVEVGSHVFLKENPLPRFARNKEKQHLENPCSVSCKAYEGENEAFRLLEVPTPERRCVRSD